MKSILRFAFLLSLPLLLSTPTRAANVDDNLPNAQALLALELRAQQANPRDQCFLYTELVHVMTEMAGKQMINGDVDQATATLKKVNAYALLIHVDLASNSKRVKNAEELMHHTSYRLGSISEKPPTKIATPCKPPSSSSIRSTTNFSLRSSNTRNQCTPGSG